MGKFYDRIESVVNSHFSEEWLKNYVVKNQEGKCVLESQKLEDDRKGLLDIVIQDLFKSLLEGEYVIRRKLVKDIDSLLEFLPGHFDELHSDDEIQAKVYDIVKRGLVDVLKTYYNLYKNFIRLIEYHQKHPKLEIIWESNQISNYIKDSEIQGDELNRVDFFYAVTRVYHFDHFFRDSDYVFNNLMKLENDVVSKFSNFKYASVVKEKVKFLIYKWETRQKSYNRSDASIFKAYMADSDLFFSTDDVSLSSQNPDLIFWGRFIHCHYEFDDWKFRLGNDVSSYKSNINSGLKVLQLVKLVKYFKDVESNYINLKLVVEIIGNLYESNTNKKESYVYSKLYLYALNNQFSLLLEQSNVVDEDIAVLKETIESFQSQIGVENFFIDSKYIDYVLRKIEKRLSTRKEFEDFSNEKMVLDRLSQSIESYKKNLRWSKNKHNLLFQLPYDESIVKIDEDLSIYYASSVVLPLSQEESQTFFDKLNDRYNKLNLLINSRTSLAKEFDEISKMRDEIKKSDIKTLEIIGLFTAIATFILASVPSFSFVKSLYDAFRFTTILGCSMFILVTTIFLFTRGYSRIKVGWYIVLPVVLLLGVTILTTNGILDKTIEKKVESKFDSIKKVNKTSIERKIKEGLNQSKDTIQKLSKPQVNVGKAT